MRKRFALPGNIAYFVMGLRDAPLWRNPGKKAFQCHFVYHISQPCTADYAHVGQSIWPATVLHTAHSHLHFYTTPYAKCLQINGDTVAPAMASCHFVFRQEEWERKHTHTHTKKKRREIRMPIFFLVARSLCDIYGRAYNLEHSRVNLTSLRRKMIHNDVIKSHFQLKRISVQLNVKSDWTDGELLIPLSLGPT